MNAEPEVDDMPPEYDLASMGEPEVGKYYVRYWKSRGGRVLEPDLAKRFEDSESVNEALRDYLRIKAESA
jgi:hypothetical protein